MTARRFTLCHTADWHLGHTLHRRSRDHEHARFLVWLADQLEARAADALVVAGDVFDSGNPPGTALALFYSFLAEIRRRMPALAVIVIAGNHDSPARLAAPDPLLSSLRVRIVGSVPYDGSELAAERMVVPIVDAHGEGLAQVAAVPFLRASDLPAVREASWSSDVHASGVREVYEQALRVARERRRPREALIATGHFAAAGARMSRDSERLVFGGADGTLPIDVVPAEAGVGYLALGHLHLAQEVARSGGGETRYAGSPIPLAFSERTFTHEVRFATFADGELVGSEGVQVPRIVPFVRVPAAGTVPVATAIALLADVAETGEEEACWPWVEIRAHASAGERDAASRIRDAAQGRRFHLLKVTVDAEEAAAEVRSHRPLEALDVREVFLAKWREEREAEPDEAVLRALEEAADEARARLEARGREPLTRRSDEGELEALEPATEERDVTNELVRPVRRARPRKIDALAPRDAETVGRPGRSTGDR
jgi:exonuclease SbcD